LTKEIQVFGITHPFWITKDINMTDEVGYGRPPQKTRFKPGQSGNPSGRRRSALNVRAEIETELTELMSLSKGDQRATISKARVVIKSVVAAAINGNMTAAKLILDLVIKIEPNKEGSADQQAADDRELLRKFLDSELEKRNAQAEPKS
jgi:hypothetical protein